MVGDTHFRFSGGFGPRHVHEQMMSNSDWDIAMELGIGVYKSRGSDKAYYGLETHANTGWSSRFNSVNSATDTTTTTLLVHNSSSMDVMAFVGKALNERWSAEIGAGGQLSWVKWLGSTQQATDRSRLVPKVRIGLNRKVTDNGKVFVAVNHAFNTYDKLGCSSGSANCFDDEGFASVTDVKLGVMYEME